MSFSIKYRQITDNQVPDDCSEIEFFENDDDNNDITIWRDNIDSDAHVIPVLEPTNRHYYTYNNTLVDGRLKSLTSYQETQYFQNPHTYFNSDSNKEQCTLSEIYVKVSGLTFDNNSSTDAAFNLYNNGDDITITISLQITLESYREDGFSKKIYTINNTENDSSLFNFVYDGRDFEIINGESYYVFRIPTYYLIQKYLSYFKDYSPYYSDKDDLGFGLVYYYYNRELYVFYAYRFDYSIVSSVNETTFTATPTNSLYFRLGKQTHGARGSNIQKIFNYVNQTSGLVYTKQEKYPSAVAYLKLQCNDKFFFQYYSNYNSFFPDLPSSSTSEILSFSDISSCSTLTCMSLSQYNNSNNNNLSGNNVSIMNKLGESQSIIQDNDDQSYYIFSNILNREKLKSWHYRRTYQFINVYNIPVNQFLSKLDWLNKTVSGDEYIIDIDLLAAVSYNNSQNGDFGPKETSGVQISYREPTSKLVSGHIDYIDPIKQVFFETLNDEQYIIVILNYPMFKYTVDEVREPIYDSHVYVEYVNLNENTSSSVAVSFIDTDTYSNISIYSSIFNTSYNGAYIYKINNNISYSANDYVKIRFNPNETMDYLGILNVDHTNDVNHRRGYFNLFNFENTTQDIPLYSGTIFNYTIHRQCSSLVVGIKESGAVDDYTYFPIDKVSTQNSELVDLSTESVNVKQTIPFGTLISEYNGTFDVLFKAEDIYGIEETEYLIENIAIDNEAPIIQPVNDIDVTITTPSNNDYAKENEEVSFTIKFNEDINIIDTTIVTFKYDHMSNNTETKIQIDNTDISISSSDSQTLIATYTVTSNDYGTIKFVSASNVSDSVGNIYRTQNEIGLTHTSNILLDGSSPIIQPVNNIDVTITTPSNNNYAKENEEVSFTIKFNEDIEISDTTSVSFKIDDISNNYNERTIHIDKINISISSSDTQTLIATYDVNSHDYGIIKSVSVFNVNDIAGNLYTNLDSDGNEIVLNITSNFLLDNGVVPTVTSQSIVSSNSNPNYATATKTSSDEQADELSITIGFDKEISKTSDMQIQFNIGAEVITLDESDINVQGKIMNSSYTIQNTHNGNVENLKILNISDTANNMIEEQIFDAYDPNIFVDQIPFEIFGIEYSRLYVNSTDGFFITFRTSKKLYIPDNSAEYAFAFNFEYPDGVTSTTSRITVSFMPQVINEDENESNFQYRILESRTITLLQFLNEDLNQGIVIDIHKIEIDPMKDMYGNTNTFAKELSENEKIQIKNMGPELIQDFTSLTNDNIQIHIKFNQTVYSDKNGSLIQNNENGFSDNFIFEESDENLYAFGDILPLSPTILDTSIYADNIFRMSLPSLKDNFFPDGTETITLSFIDIYDIYGNPAVDSNANNQTNKLNMTLNEQHPVEVTISTSSNNAYAKNNEQVFFTLKFNDDIDITDITTLTFKYDHIYDNEEKEIQIDIANISTSSSELNTLIATYTVTDIDYGIIKDVTIYTNRQENVILNTLNFLLDNGVVPTVTSQSIVSSNSNPNYATATKTSSDEQADELSITIGFDKEIAKTLDMQIQFNIGDKTITLNKSDITLQGNNITSSYTIQSDDIGKVENLKILNISDTANNIIEEQIFDAYESNIFVDQTPFEIFGIEYSRLYVNSTDGFFITFKTSKKLYIPDNSAEYAFAFNFDYPDGTTNTTSRITVTFMPQVLNEDEDENNFTYGIRTTRIKYVLQKLDEHLVQGIVIDIHKIDIDPMKDMYGNTNTFSKELSENERIQIKDKGPELIQNFTTLYDDNDELHIKFNQTVYSDKNGSSIQNNVNGFSDNFIFEESDENLYAFGDILPLSATILDTSNFTNIFRMTLPSLQENFFPNGTETITLSFINIYDIYGNPAVDSNANNPTNKFSFTLNEQLPVNVTISTSLNNHYAKKNEQIFFTMKFTENIATTDIITMNFKYDHIYDNYNEKEIQIDTANISTSSSELNTLIATYTVTDTDNGTIKDVKIYTNIEENVILNTSNFLLDGYSPIIQPVNDIDVNISTTSNNAYAKENEQVFFTIKFNENIQLTDTTSLIFKYDHIFDNVEKTIQIDNTNIDIIGGDNVESGINYIWFTGNEPFIELYEIECYVNGVNIFAQKSNSNAYFTTDNYNDRTSIGFMGNLNPVNAIDQDLTTLAHHWRGNADYTNYKNLLIEIDESFVFSELQRIVVHKRQGESYRNRWNGVDFVKLLDASGNIINELDQSLENFDDVDYVNYIGDDDNNLLSENKLVGDNVRNINFFSSDTLIATYTVNSNDNGIVKDVSVSNVSDYVGNLYTNQNSLTHTSNILIDGNTPIIQPENNIDINISTSTNNTYVKENEQVIFTIKFNETIQLIDTTTVTFKYDHVFENNEQSIQIDNTNISISSGDSKTLIATYTVTSNDYGTIKSVSVSDVTDIAGNIYTNQNTLVHTSDILLDGYLPIVTSQIITTTNSNSNYATATKIPSTELADILLITFEFNKDMIKLSDINIKFKIGSKDIILDSSQIIVDNKKITSSYTIQIDDVGSVTNLAIYNISDEVNNIITELTFYDYDPNIFVDQTPLEIVDIEYSRLYANSNDGFDIKFTASKNINNDNSDKCGIKLYFDGGNYNTRNTYVVPEVADEINFQYIIPSDTFKDKLNHLSDEEGVVYIDEINITNIKDLYGNTTSFTDTLSGDERIQIKNKSPELIQNVTNLTDDNDEIVIRFNQVVYSDKNGTLIQNNENGFSDNFIFEESDESDNEYVFGSGLLPLGAIIEFISNNNTYRLILPSLKDNFFPFGNENITLSMINIYDIYGNPAVDSNDTNPTNKLTFTLHDKYPVDISKIDSIKLIQNPTGDSSLLSEIIELTYDNTTNTWIQGGNDANFLTLTNKNNAYQYQIDFNTTLGGLTVTMLTRITNSSTTFGDISSGETFTLSDTNYDTKNPFTKNVHIQRNIFELVELKLSLIITEFHTGNKILITNDFDDSTPPVPYYNTTQTTNGQVDNTFTYPMDLGVIYYKHPNVYELDNFIFLNTSSNASQVLFYDTYDSNGNVINPVNPVSDETILSNDLNYLTLEIKNMEIYIDEPTIEFVDSNDKALAQPISNTYSNFVYQIFESQEEDYNPSIQSRIYNITILGIKTLLNDSYFLNIRFTDGIGKVNERVTEFIIQRPIPEIQGNPVIIEKNTIIRFSFDKTVIYDTQDINSHFTVTVNSPNNIFAFSGTPTISELIINGNHEFDFNVPSIVEYGNSSETYYPDGSEQIDFTIKNLKDDFGNYIPDVTYTLTLIDLLPDDVNNLFYLQLYVSSNNNIFFNYESSSNTFINNSSATFTFKAYEEIDIRYFYIIPANFQLKAYIFVKIDDQITKEGTVANIMSFSRGFYVSETMPGTDNDDFIGEIYIAAIFSDSNDNIYVVSNSYDDNDNHDPSIYEGSYEKPPDKFIYKLDCKTYRKEEFCNISLYEDDLNISYDDSDIEIINNNITLLDNLKTYIINDVSLDKTYEIYFTIENVEPENQINIELFDASSQSLTGYNLEIDIFQESSVLNRVLRVRILDIETMNLEFGSFYELRYSITDGFGITSSDSLNIKTRDIFAVITSYPQKYVPDDTLVKKMHYTTEDSITIICSDFSSEVDTSFIPLVSVYQYPSININTTQESYESDIIHTVFNEEMTGISSNRYTYELGKVTNHGYYGVTISAMNTVGRFYEINEYIFFIDGNRPIIKSSNVKFNPIIDYNEHSFFHDSYYSIEITTENVTEETYIDNVGSSPQENETKETAVIVLNGISYSSEVIDNSATITIDKSDITYLENKEHILTMYVKDSVDNVSDKITSIIEMKNNPYLGDATSFDSENQFIVSNDSELSFNSETVKTSNNYIELKFTNLLTDNIDINIYSTLPIYSVTSSSNTNSTDEIIYTGLNTIIFGPFSNGVYKNNYMRLTRFVDNIQQQEIFTLNHVDVKKYDINIEEMVVVPENINYHSNIPIVLISNIDDDTLTSENFEIFCENENYVNFTYTLNSVLTLYNKHQIEFSISNSVDQYFEQYDGDMLYLKVTDNYGNVAIMKITSFYIDMRDIVISESSLSNTKYNFESSETIKITFNKKVYFNQGNFSSNYFQISELTTYDNIKWTINVTMIQNYPNEDSDGNRNTLFNDETIFSIDSIYDDYGNTIVDYNYLHTFEFDTLKPVVTEFLLDSSNTLRQTVVGQIVFNKYMDNIDGNNIEIIDLSYGSIQNVELDTTDNKKYNFEFVPTDDIYIEVTSPSVKLLSLTPYKDSFDNIGEVSELYFNTDTLSTRYNFIINTKPYVILDFNVSTLINSNTYPILQSYITQFFTIDIIFENPIDGQYLKDIKLKYYSENEDENNENIFDSYFITDDFNFTSEDNIQWKSTLELKNYNVNSTGLFIFYYIFDDIEYKSNVFIIDSQEKMVDTSSSDKSSYIVGEYSNIIEGDLIDSNNKTLNTLTPRLKLKLNAGKELIKIVQVNITLYIENEDGTLDLLELKKQAHNYDESYNLVIFFDEIPMNNYKNNTVRILDITGNIQDNIEIYDFTVDTVAPVIEELIGVRSITYENPPSYTFKCIYETPTVPTGTNFNGTVIVFFSDSDDESLTTITVKQMDDDGNLVEDDSIIIENGINGTEHKIYFDLNHTEIMNANLYKLSIQVKLNSDYVSNIINLSSFQINVYEPKILTFESDGVYEFEIDESGKDTTISPNRFLITTEHIANNEVILANINGYYIISETDDDVIYTNTGKFNETFQGVVYDNKCKIDINMEFLMGLKDHRTYFVEFRLQDLDTIDPLASEYFAYEKICDSKTALQNIRVTQYSNNVDTSTFTTAGRSSGNNIDFTKYSYAQYKERRKYNTLQFSKNSNISLTKKTKNYSEIMKGKSSHNLKQVSRKTLLFTSSYNKNSSNLKRVGNGLVLTASDGSECNKKDSILDVDLHTSL